jgi:histidinol dehydrogenase
MQRKPSRGFLFYFMGVRRRVLFAIRSENFFSLIRATVRIIGLVDSAYIYSYIFAQNSNDMIQHFDLQTSSGKKNFLRQVRGTDFSIIDPIEKQVATILHRVQKEGDGALRYYSKKFDGISVESFRVPDIEIKKSFSAADPSFVRILKEAAANIRSFHQRQLPSAWTVRAGSGAELQQRFLPLDSVGVYIPGGTAAYPSTVLMNVIPAQVAGVSEIHLASPASAEGSVHPEVLVAAAILGIKNIYRVGGAQAIAAFAFGTQSIPRVDKIVGPGNIFVATAKKLLFGTVGIDGIAGPSEVVILADDTADPQFVASDMLAQAEHDERASSILVTSSRRLALRTETEIKKLITILPRRAIIAESLRMRGAIVTVKNIDDGIAAVNSLAPEHLEIITRNDAGVLKKIRHAGSIFIGNYSPVAIGDYFAGPNHVLPTGRTARFSSPLSVEDFLRRSSVTKYSEKQIRSVGKKIALFAEHEGLDAHAISVRLRTRKETR